MVFSLQPGILILEQSTGGRLGLGLVIYRLDKAWRPSACTQGCVCSPTFLCGLPCAGRVYFLEVWPCAANSSLNSKNIVFFNYYYCIGIVPSCALLASIPITITIGATIGVSSIGSTILKRPSRYRLVAKRHSRRRRTTIIIPLYCPCRRQGPSINNPAQLTLL